MLDTFSFRSLSIHTKRLIDGAELFLSRYIAVGARVEGFKRIDIPEGDPDEERGSALRRSLQQSDRSCSLQASYLSARDSGRMGILPALILSPG
jgi:hypothetical protein